MGDTGGMGGGGGAPIEDPLHPADSSLADRRKAEFAAKNRFDAGAVTYYRRPADASTG